MALVSIQEAAQALGVSPDTVRRRIKAGRWPYYPLGPKAIRLDVDEIKSLGRLIAEGQQQGKKKIEID